MLFGEVGVLEQVDPQAVSFDHAERLVRSDLVVPDRETQAIDKEFQSIGNVDVEDVWDEFFEFHCLTLIRFSS